MIKFPILKKEETFELSYGLYNLYLSGGFSADNLDLLDIHLIKLETNQTITLKEKSLKLRENINGQKAICCFDFHIENSGVYQIEISNPEIIIMKKSYDNSFSIFQLFFQNRIVNSENINIIIK